VAQEGEVRAIPHRDLDVVLQLFSACIPRVPDFGGVDLESSYESVAVGIPVNAQRTSVIGVGDDIEGSRDNVLIHKNAIPSGGMELVVSQRRRFRGRVGIVREAARENSVFQTRARKGSRPPSGSARDSRRFRCNRRGWHVRGRDIFECDFRNFPFLSVAKSFPYPRYRGTRLLRLIPG
jgi:hypothetical protein